jgi:hypothetical protein
MVLLTTYHSGYQIEHNEMGRACSRNGERREAYSVLVGKPEGRIERNRWVVENNMKMDLPEVGCWAWMD